MIMSLIESLKIQVPVIYQPSKDATQLGAGQFVCFCSCTCNALKGLDDWNIKLK